MEHKINVRTLSNEELASLIYWSQKEQKRRRIEKRDCIKQNLNVLIEGMEKEGFTLALKHADGDVTWLWPEDLIIVPISTDWDLDDNDEEE